MKSFRSIRGLVAAIVVMGASVLLPTVASIASSSAAGASSVTAACPSGGTRHGSTCTVAISKKFAMSGTACVDNGGHESRGICYVTYKATL